VAKLATNVGKTGTITPMAAMSMSTAIMMNGMAASRERNFSRTG
jgi:hypothetical protein